MTKDRLEETLEYRTIKAPVKGSIVPMEDVNDPVFNKNMLGVGVAILPTEGKVIAPDNGYVRALFPSNHAIALQLDTGEQVLIHIGLDTLELQGKGIKSYVKKNDKFQAGDLLIEFDIEMITSKGYDIITPIIITNSNDFRFVEPSADFDEVTTKDPILTISK